MERSESGVALVEFALVVVGLFVGLLIFVDVCRGLCTYFTMSGIAAEAIRTATKVPALESSPASQTNLVVDVTTSSGQQTKSDCDNLRATSFPCGHWFIHQRIQEMARLMELDIVPNSLQYTTSYNTATGTVSVDIRASLNTLSWAAIGRYFTPQLPIRVQAQGPYLFN